MKVLVIDLNLAVNLSGTTVSGFTVTVTLLKAEALTSPVGG